jgi:hypothetical protein
MDEEEELDNTLIGQEEEAPAVNTGDVIMGTPAPAFGQGFKYLKTPLLILLNPTQLTMKRQHFF